MDEEFWLKKQLDYIQKAQLSIPLGEDIVIITFSKKNYQQFCNHFYIGTLIFKVKIVNS